MYLLKILHPFFTLHVWHCPRVNLPTQAQLIASWHEMPCYNSCYLLVNVAIRLNSAMYVKNIVQPFLLIFLQQEGKVLFQQDNACSHGAHTTNHEKMFENFPSWHGWTYIKDNDTTFYLFSLPTPLVLYQQVQVVWNNVLQDAIYYIYNLMHSRLCTRRVYTVY